MFKNILDSQDRTSFNQAIGLHIIILVMSLVAPDIFSHRSRLPEIYTVNLFRVTELPEQPPVEQPVANRRSEDETAEPVAAAKVALEPETSKSDIATVPAGSVPNEIISINPAGQKIKKTTPSPPPVDRQALEKLRLKQALASIKAEQNLRAAEQNLRTAKKKASEATASAVDKLRQSLQTTATVKTYTGETPAPASSATATDVGGPQPDSPGVEVDEAMKHYFSAVYQRIHQHWILPDLQNWDSTLQGIVIISVRRDGTIIKSHFESKSSNTYFNQSLIKAVQAAEPLPRFPAEFKENSLEIGLRFRLQDML